MKVYLAKDWKGCHMYKSEPKLLEHLPSFPPTWSGYEFNIDNPFTEEEIPYKKFITKNIFLTIL